MDNWADSNEVLETHGFNLIEAIPDQSCDALVIAVSHDEFRKYSPNELKRFFRDSAKAVLGDVKSIYNKADCEAAGFAIFRF